MLVEPITNLGYAERITTARKCSFIEEKDPTILSLSEILWKRSYDKGCSKKKTLNPSLPEYLKDFPHICLD